MFIKFISHTFATLAAAYGVISWLLQIGPFAFLIRLQDQLIGTYFPFITGALMTFIFWSIPFIFFIRLGKAKAIQAQKELTEKEFKKQLIRPVYYTSLSLLVCLAIAAVAYLWSQKATNAEEIVVDLSEPITRPLVGDDSLWFKRITLIGKPLPEQSYLIESSGKRGTTSFDLYLPIAPAEGDQPVQIVYNLSGSDVSKIDINKITNKGFIIPFAVPALTRDFFEAEGIELADRVYMVSPNKLDERTAAYIVLGISGTIGLILFILLLTYPSGNKKKLKVWKAEHEQNNPEEATV